MIQVFRRNVQRGKPSFNSYISKRYFPIFNQEAKSKYSDPEMMKSYQAAAVLRGMEKDPEKEHQNFREVEVKPSEQYDKLRTGMVNAQGRGSKPENKIDVGLGDGMSLYQTAIKYAFWTILTITVVYVGQAEYRKNLLKQEMKKPPVDLVEEYTKEKAARLEAEQAAKDAEEKLAAAQGK